MSHLRNRACAAGAAQLARIIDEKDWKSNSMESQPPLSRADRKKGKFDKDKDGGRKAHAHV